jgi:hypothetical protein
MSIHAVSWALKIPFIRPGDKLILIAIANFADEWGVCWPGIDTLVEHTNFSERKVRDGIATLEGAGLIATVPRRRDDGTRRTDVVVLVGFDGRRRASRSEDNAVVDLVAVDRAHEERGGATALRPDDGVDNPVDHTVNRQDLPVDVHASDPPSTGRIFHSNRQILPVHIRNEPSVEPSGEEEERACARAPGCSAAPDARSQHQDPPDEPPPDERRASTSAGAAANASAAALVERICRALGRPELAEERWWRIEADFGRRIAAWREMGLDDEAIVAVAKAFGREMPQPPSGPKALDSAMARAAKRPKAEKKPAHARTVPPARPTPAWPEDCRDMIEFFGRKIAAGEFVSPVAVTIPMAREMLARGLVKPDDLRRRGIAA